MVIDVVARLWILKRSFDCPCQSPVPPLSRTLQQFANAKEKKKKEKRKRIFSISKMTRLCMCFQFNFLCGTFDISKFHGSNHIRRPSQFLNPLPLYHSIRCLINIEWTIFVITEYNLATVLPNFPREYRSPTGSDVIAPPFPQAVSGLFQTVPEFERHGSSFLFITILFFLVKSRSHVD